MSIQITIPVKTIYYTEDQLKDWIEGSRDNCIDPYCKKLPGSYGFGENLVGNYFEDQGYKWIHHDCDIFGYNRLRKYPFAEEVILKCIDEKKISSAKTIYKAFNDISEPDLFIYKPDFSEIRFAESKRLDTGDELSENQIRGLALLSLLFKCKVEVFDVAKYGVKNETKAISFEF